MQFKKKSVGGQTRFTNGMDEFQDINNGESMDLSKLINSVQNQSNANISKLGGGLNPSKLETISTKYRPLIPKPPQNNLGLQKAAILDSTNHIKRILMECNVMRTRSKKYDGPNDVHYPSEFKQVIAQQHLISPKRKNIDSRQFQSLDSMDAIQSHYN